MFQATLRGAYEHLMDAKGSVDFVYYGGGLSHLMGLNAFVTYMKDEGLGHHGIVVNAAPPDRLHTFREEAITSLEEDEYVIVERWDTSDLTEREGSFDKARSKIAGKMQALALLRKRETIAAGVEIARLDDPLCLLFPQCGDVPEDLIAVLMGLGRPIIHVSLEEGTGTYNMSLHDWRRLGAKRTQGLGRRLAMSAKALAMNPLNDLIQSSFAARTHHFSFTLLREQNGRLIPNEVACRYQACAYRDHARRIGMPAADYSNTVIIATTKFEAFDGEGLERAALEDAIRIVRACGLEPLLRPHPGTKDRSRYAELDVPVDEHVSMTLESLISISENPPRAILGFMSSSQLFASLLWQVPCMTLDGIVDAHRAEAAGNYPLKRYIRDMRKYQERFSEYVTASTCPDDVRAFLVAAAQRDAQRMGNGDVCEGVSASSSQMRADSALAR